MKNFILCSLVLLFGCHNPSTEILISNKNSNEDNRIEVVLLGSWHFSNPGADEYNMTSDDFFAPKRQKEINDLNQHLAKFNPDKIFIEHRTNYQKYFDSLYQLPNLNFEDIPDGYGVSESYQIGFKLGKLLNHKKVYGADAEGIWLGSQANKIAADQYSKMDNTFSHKMEKSIKYYDDFISKHTISEALIEMNHPDSILTNGDFYLNFFTKVINHTEEEGVNWFSKKDQDSERQRMAGTFDQKYIGAELVAEWYKRNIKIYSKILEQMEPHDKKIFILFGAGHIRILRHLFEDNTKFKIVEVNDFLKI